MSRRGASSTLSVPPFGHRRPVDGLEAPRHSPKAGTARRAGRLLGPPEPLICSTASLRNTCSGARPRRAYGRRLTLTEQVQVRHHPRRRCGKWTYRRCGRPDPQAQISASLGTRLCVITLPMRETFIRCLKSRFSEIELPPQEPQPSVVVGANPLVSDPPAVSADA